MATSRLAKYILSEEFHQNARRGVADAVAKTRAAGLTPAGDTRVKRAPRPAAVVTVEAPSPISPKRKTLRAA